MCDRPIESADRVQWEFVALIRMKLYRMYSLLYRNTATIKYLDSKTSWATTLLRIEHEGL